MPDDSETRVTLRLKVVRNEEAVRRFRESQGLTEEVTVYLTGVEFDSAVPGVPADDSTVIEVYARDLQSMVKNATDDEAIIAAVSWKRP